MLPILLILHDRFAYSALTYQCLKKHTRMNHKILIWNNASSDETRIWLRHLKKIDPDVYIIDSVENRGISYAMNYFITRFEDFPVLAKVDNDTLLPDGWDTSLLSSMIANRLDIVSGWLHRPYGDTWESWSARMRQEKASDHTLYFNDYVAGTGVLFKTELFKKHGLMYETFGQLGTWTYFQRKVSAINARIAFHSGVYIDQLSLKKEHEYSRDYPEYDKKIHDIREAGNKVWTDIGGMNGMEKYIKDGGGVPTFEEKRKEMQY